jgi:hypothetical protein
MKALRSPVLVQSRTSVAVALSPIIRTDSREKDATEPVQFGTEIGLRRFVPAPVWGKSNEC